MKQETYVESQKKTSFGVKMYNLWLEEPGKKFVESGERDRSWGY